MGENNKEGSFSSSESRSLITLLSGNVLAQLIPFVFSPVFSRIFSPEEFGELALLMSITNPISILICFRYETAIVVPEKESMARDLLRLSLRINLIFSALLSIIAFFLVLFFSNNQYIGRYETIVLLVAPIVFAIGLTNSFSFYFQRKKRFSTVATVKIIQMGGITAFNFLFAFLAVNNGLSFGYAAGWILCSMVALFIFRKNEQTRLFGREEKEISAMKTYSAFPIYNGIPEFLTTIALSVPVFIFMNQFGEKETGYLNLSRQVLYFPASFIAVALSQYYFQEFSVNFRHKKALMPVVIKILKLTIPIATAMIIVLILAGPFLFSTLFGSQWERSGELSVILCTLFAFQLCIIPLQTYFSATGHNQLFGLFKMLSFLFGMVLLLPTYESPKEFLYIYVIGEGMIWLISMCTVFYMARLTDRKHNALE